MTTRPVIADGLWRCLCPSFQPNSSALRRFARIRPLNGSILHPNSSHCRRTQSTTPSHFDSNPLPPVATNDEGLTPSGHSRRTRGAVASLFEDNSSVTGRGVTSPSRSEVKARKRNADPDLVSLSTPELYERLKKPASSKIYGDVFNVVKILLRDRRELPNLAMYSAMILSFVSPEDGTAGMVRKLLEDMREDGIELDSQTCHHVLEALAVHPDHLLRNEILEYMRNRWFTLSDRGHNMVVAGLLRDRFFEQALDKLEDMVRQRIKVQPWVFDKAIYFLLDYGEVEEAYQLLSSRLHNCEAPVSYTLYSQLLDTAARLQYAEAAKHVWNTQVIPGYVKPPTSTCLLTLSLASRIGDVNLGTDVFRVLTERQIIFDTHHYELLLQTYLHPASGNLPAALNIILIMAESGMHPTEAALHPLYTYLSAKKERPLEAFTILQSFEASGKQVPTAAVNVCIQSSIQHRNLPEAIEIYKALHTVSKAGPTTNTFNILFRGCYRATRDVPDDNDTDNVHIVTPEIRQRRQETVKKELAMFLASEMLQLGLEPNALTYDRLVHVCALAGDSDDAFAYYEEMRNQGFTGRRGMYSYLIDVGLIAGDERTVAVLEDMRAAGFRPKKEDARAVSSRFMNRIVGEARGGVSAVGEARSEGGMEGDMGVAAEANDGLSLLEETSRKQGRVD
ncbi:hypothetical protein BDV96DRAFT_691605 [Lophiotrema nucula]|uniref:Pentatricopeptide repeat-containing protein-mitochondrial domain-containing protein n=1 Tax=Lophiotrema nucula TaxID=690887 RepID=A0A6A5YSJ9_9PLEO|nr:hypothetical protein BDV96DRAFT_691605 [Lophiotrema nucula]